MDDLEGQTLNSKFPVFQSCLGGRGGMAGHEQRHRPRWEPLFQSLSACSLAQKARGVSSPRAWASLRTLRAAHILANARIPSRASQS